MDGDLLLAAVMRTRARDRTAVGALLDWLIEHQPATGDEVRVHHRARTRYGRLELRRGLYSAAGDEYLRLTAVHGRGVKGTRSSTILEEPRSPHLHSRLAVPLAVFRS